ncbi:MAG: AIR synthase-related protein [Patescibacteria group bacterium]
MAGNIYKAEVIDPGDRASRLAKEICYASHGNNAAVTVVPHQPNNFRGPVGFTWKRHILNMMLEGAMLMEVENDGAGGKPQFFTLAGTPEAMAQLGWEIITMTADDFVRSGRFPGVMLNDFNVKRITDANYPLVEAVFNGYGRALSQAGLVNITGEIAVMKHSITAFCDTKSDDQLVCTWGGACIGLSHRDLLLDSSKIRPGMIVVGLWEPGYRCNGGTVLTNILLLRYGPNIKDIMNNATAMDFVRKLTVPSRSYARSLCRILGWQPDGNVGRPLARIAGIAHITGGGVWGKFGEILPEGVGARLDSMPIPAEVLYQAQDMSWGTEYHISDWQAYGNLHGGCGMLIVVEPDDAKRLLDELGQDNISAYVVGITTESADREILISSRFREKKLLSSLLPE